MAIYGESFQPPDEQPLSFYCNKCDSSIVNSKHPETGKFFLQSGHVWQGFQRGGASEEYVMVIFALCKGCIVEIENGKPV